MAPAQHARLRRGLRLALIALTLVKGWAWVGVTPLWKVVDEPAHFDHAQYRVERGRAPRWNGAHLQAVMNPGASPELRRSWDVTQRYWRAAYPADQRAVPEEAELQQLAAARDSRTNDGQMLEMSYPGFYYELVGLPYRLFRRSSIVTRAFAMRLGSVAFGLLAVLCAFAAAGLVLDDPWLAFAVGVLVALQPMASQQTAAINNDAAAIGVGALLFYLQARALARWPAPPSWRELGALGLICGLGLWCKPHLVAFVPATATVMAVAAWPWRRDRRAWWALAAGALGFALLALPAVPVLKETTRVLDALNKMTRPQAPAVTRGFVGWLWNAAELRDNIFDAYWGRFAWTELSFDREWFDWLHLARWLVLAGAAWALLARAFGIDGPWWRRRGIALAAATVLLLDGFVWYMEYRAQAQLHIKWVLQGRHLLPALPALALLVVWALAAPLPPRLRRWAAAAVVTAAALIDLGGLATIARYHYGN